MTETGRMTTLPAQDRSYWPALDGLRGIAVAGVLLFHTGHLPGGFLGVDLFFALSGFLITDRLLREIAATGRLSLPDFFARRTRRLFPSLAVLLAVVTATVALTQPAALARSTLADGPWVQMNLANWHLLAHSAGYWDRFGSDRVFEHLWSIAVEEQFYLLWPLLVLGVVACARPLEKVQLNVALLAAALSLGSLLLMAALLDPRDPSRVYTGTDTRAFSLLLGALAATAPVRSALKRLPRLTAGACVLILGVIWSMAEGTTSTWLFQGGLFAHSLAAAVLIALCTIRPDAAIAKGLSLGPLRWLGEISYGLYLWHWPVIVLLSPERTGLWTVGVIAVSLAAAVVSKRFVEDPVRFRAPWARGRSGALAFSAAMVLLALIWLLTPEPAPPIVDLGSL